VQPETLPSEHEQLARHAHRIPEPFRKLWLERERPFEFRPVEPVNPLKPRPAAPVAHNWFKAAAPVAPDPVLARCLLAYASDMTLLDTCLLPHGVPWTDPNLQVASIDHALWFHADPPLDEWLLYAQDSPVSGGGRGMNRGLIFARDGRLVATAMQEGLIRYRSPS
jgi:acyl-CoA thioesterase-2